MRKLGVRNYALISMGVKTMGSYDPNEILFLFEKSLYRNEVKEIIAFLEWVTEDKENRAFGSGNYEQRFKEFKNIREKS